MYWKNYQQQVREIIEQSESLSLDSREDREALIAKLSSVNPQPKKIEYRHNSECGCTACECVFLANQTNGHEPINVNQSGCS